MLTLLRVVAVVLGLLLVSLGISGGLAWWRLVRTGAEPPLIRLWFMRATLATVAGIGFLVAVALTFVATGVGVWAAVAASWVLVARSVIDRVLVGRVRRAETG